MEGEDSFGFSKDMNVIARRPSFSNSLDSKIKKGAPQGLQGYGWLQKKSSTGRWNKRFVVVHGHYVSYFKVDPGTLKDRVPVAALDLWTVEGVSLDESIISLRLSPHAFQARLEEMGGEKAKKIISSSLAKGLVKKIDKKRRNDGKAPMLTFKANNQAEAQNWLLAMRESPYMGSLANLHKTLDEQGEIWVKELQLSLPPSRNFVFAELQFSDATDILVRDIPESGSKIKVTVSSKGADVEGSAPFEPRLQDGSGIIDVALPAEIMVKVEWKRRKQANETVAAVGAGGFGIMFFATLVLSKGNLLVSILAGIIVGASAAGAFQHQLSKSNDIVIRTVEVLKPDLTTSPGAQRRRKALSNSPPASPKGKRGKSSGAMGDTARAAVSGANYTSTDPLVTPEEAALIPELRERVKDMYQVQDSPEFEAFLKKNEKFLKEWHADFKEMKDPEVVKRVMDKHIGTDFRLVRYLRARRNKIDKAEDLLRAALMYRLAMGIDLLHENKEMVPHPPEYIVTYVGARDMMSMIRPVEDFEARISRFWVRDKDGHLGVFFRVGRANLRKVFKKMASNPNYMFKLVMWACEMLRTDMERYKAEHCDGKVDPYITVFGDLEGFSISDQIPMGDIIPIARKFFPIFAQINAELLNKILVFNAPWLFGNLYNALKFAIPEEVQEKIKINTGKVSFDKDVKPYFNADQVPKCYGGNLVDSETGEDNCLDRVAPFGPNGLKDKGDSLLAGKDPKAEAW